MKLRILFLLLLPALLLAGAGCHHESGPPPALALENIPATLDQAFAKAKPEARELVAQAKTAIGGKDYAVAFQLVQTLGGLEGNTPEQLLQVGRANQTLLGLLQTAQAQGDSRAAATVELYKATK